MAVVFIMDMIIITSIITAITTTVIKRTLHQRWPPPCTEGIRLILPLRDKRKGAV